MLSQETFKLHMVTHACNPGTGEVEVGDQDLKASLSYMASLGYRWPCFFKKKTKNRKTLTLL